MMIILTTLIETNKAYFKDGDVYTQSDWKLRCKKNIGDRYKIYIDKGFHGNDAENSYIYILNTNDSKVYVTKEYRTYTEIIDWLNKEITGEADKLRKEKEKEFNPFDGI